MRPSMSNAQLSTLWYRSTNWLADLNLNIPANTRDCFMLIDFLATLYFGISKAVYIPGGEQVRLLVEQ
jgi:hypothetical protein